jgi:hypothetical protein
MAMEAGSSKAIAVARMLGASVLAAGRASDTMRDAS